MIRCSPEEREGLLAEVARAHREDCGDDLLALHVGCAAVALDLTQGELECAILPGMNTQTPQDTSRAVAAVAAFRPGVHDHYKGGRYTALFLARAVPIEDYDDPEILLEVRHHDTREVLKVFKYDGGRSLCVDLSIRRASGSAARWVNYVSHTTGAVCARPLALDGEDSWSDEVVVEHPKVNRAFGPDEDGRTERRPRFRRLPDAEQPK